MFDYARVKVTLFVIGLACSIAAFGGFCFWIGLDDGKNPEPFIGALTGLGTMIALMIKLLRKPDKTIQHYVLCNGQPKDWAAIQNFARKYRVTCGFCLEEAKSAVRVTVVGGSRGITISQENQLRESGSRTQRLDGASFEATAALLENRAAAGIEWEEGYFKGGYE